MILLLSSQNEDFNIYFELKNTFIVPYNANRY